MPQALPRELRDKLRRMTPVAVEPEQQRSVQQFSQYVSKLKARRDASPRCKLVGPKGQELEIPEPVFHILARVAELLARGMAITVVPVAKELTTQQAADILNVSRQYLVRLVDENRIPFIKTGTHRRLRFDDVLAYKKQRDAGRRSQLDHLTAQSEEYGGYEGELES